MNGVSRSRHAGAACRLDFSLSRAVAGNATFIMRPSTFKFRSGMNLSNTSFRGLVSKFICIFTLCVSSGLALGQSYEYHFFKERRPLVLDVTQVAVFDVGAPSEEIIKERKRAGLDTASARALRVSGWSLVKITSENQTAAGVEAVVGRLAVEKLAEFVSPVFGGGKDDRSIVGRDLLIGIERVIPAEQAAKFINNGGVGDVMESEWAGMPNAFRIRSKSRNGFEVLASANMLAERPEVHFAEPDMLVWARHSHIPTDPLFSQSWALQNNGTSGGSAGFDLGGPAAWDVTIGSSSVIVVVLDDGIQQDHPDIHQIAGIDFTSDNGSGGPVNACDNYGTTIAGCVSAKMDNALGTCGIAPGCVVASARMGIDDVPCDGYFTAYESWVVNSLAWAQSTGARITNMSWTWGTTSSAIAQKCQDTHDAGMLHFAAAGNSAAKSVGFPASLPSVFGVGAATEYGTLAGFSNTGPGLRFVAPGVGVWSTDRTGPAGFGTGDYVVGSGSSFASPFAAGVAALVLSVNPKLSACDVEEILIASCTNMGAPGYDFTYGFGMPNAAKAVQLAALFTAPVTTGLFAGAQYKVGTYPFSIVAADLNGDGKPDLVTANANSANLSVLLANATGGFSGSTNLPITPSPVSVAIGDVNGDGKLDIVSANDTSNNISVFLGTGSGAFGPATTFATGSASGVVVLGDVNGDGKLDAATVNYYSNDISVLIGNGQGGFSAPTNYGIGTFATGLAIGDLNGDGKFDLVSVHNTGYVTVLFGNGAGGFAVSTTLSVGGFAIKGTIGDANGDGKNDILTANYGSNDVSVILGDGIGGFAPQATYAVGINPYDVKIGDMNNDGRPDLVTANLASNDVSVLLGNGSGGYAAATSHFAGNQPHAVAITDLNGDGRKDLAVADAVGNTVSVLIGDGKGGFGDLATAATPVSVTIGDLNGDGKADIVSANDQTNNISVFLGVGSGGFGSSTNFASGSGAHTAVLGDVNSDGKLDVATINDVSNNISVLMGNGAGGFSAPTNYGVAPYGTGLAMGDLNGDGKPDLVSSHHGAPSNYAGLVTILSGDGTGAFSLNTTLSVGNYAIAVTIGDANGDGNNDIATANYVSNDVSVLFGDGSGGFVGPLSYGVGVNPYSVKIGDLNRDGKPDLVTANLASNDVSVLLGLGSGVFGPATNYVAGSSPHSIVLGDLNGDGKADLAVANAVSNNVIVLFGDGSGSICETASFPVGIYPFVIEIGDLNSDGRPDLVTANANSNNITVLLNQNNPSTGVVSFGTGTAGCKGTLGMGTSAAPKVNQSNFGLTCTNAPPNTLGLGLVTDSQDLAGSDPFFLGLKLHVDFFAATQILSFDFLSDGGGFGFVSAPIPNDPSLVGQVFFAQALWVENHAAGDDCSHGMFGLESSNGISITIQP